jgi:hypothetical protein
LLVDLDIVDGLQMVALDDGRVMIIQSTILSDSRAITFGSDMTRMGRQGPTPARALTQLEVVEK